MLNKWKYRQETPDHRSKTWQWLGKARDSNLDLKGCQIGWVEEYINEKFRNL